MRKAAGVLLIVGGIAVAFPNMTLSTAPLAWTITAVAVIVFIVGGGISALRAKSYRWAFAAAICLMVITLFAAVFEALHLSASVWPRGLMHIHAWPRVLLGVAAGILFGLPGVLAHVFLARSREEFRT